MFGRGMDDARDLAIILSTDEPRFGDFYSASTHTLSRSVATLELVFDRVIKVNTDGQVLEKNRCCYDVLPRGGAVRARERVGDLSVWLLTTIGDSRQHLPAQWACPPRSSISEGQFASTERTE